MSAFLSRNVHPIERVGRVAVGAALVSLAVVGPQTPFGYIGMIPLLTGVTGNCPLYSLFGLSTCPLKSR